MGSASRLVSAIVWAALLCAACAGGGSSGSETPENVAGSGEERDAPDGSGDDSSATGATEATGESEASTVGSDDEASATTTPTTTTTTAPTTTTTVAPLVVASAELIDANVEYRTGAMADFAFVTEPVDVAVGDTVRTDATGFAQVAYFDGSMTRLDVDTEFEVLELVDDIEESVVRTKMGLGRTWHRVESLGETGEFSVETSVATAVVQGTAFSVACPTDDECSFLVVEGTVLVVLADGTEVELVAPAAVTVDGDGAGDVVSVPFDGAFGDDWLFDNAGRDADAGFESAAEIYRAHGLAYADLSGTFDVTVQPREYSSCVPDCETWIALFELDAEVTAKQRIYVFDFDCSAGFPCTGTAQIERASGTEETELTWDGTSLEFFEADYPGPYCLVDDDGDGTFEREAGASTERVAWSMTPSAAGIVDDRWVVTEMTGVVNYSFSVDDPADCPTQPEADSGINFPFFGGYEGPERLDAVRAD